MQSRLLAAHRDGEASGDERARRRGATCARGAGRGASQPDGRGRLFVLPRWSAPLDLRGREARKWRRVSHNRLSNGRDQNRRCGVEEIKLIHDTVGNTLTIWLDDPKKEAMCEETTDEVVMMKDRKGKVIGFEVLNYKPTKSPRTRGRATGNGVRVRTVRARTA